MFKSELQRLLFGYDFFIAHRTVDAGQFALSLYDALDKRGFDCFLDAKKFEAGGNLRRMQSLALKRTTRLLVVVSPRAHEPHVGRTDWLLSEILEFKRIHHERS